MMTGVEKGRPPSPGFQPLNGGANSRPSRPCMAWARTILVVLLAVVLLALAAWTIVLYSIKLVSLQDRVTKLESQCELNELHVQKYIDEKLDKLLEKVRFTVVL